MTRTTKWGPRHAGVHVRLRRKRRKRRKTSGIYLGGENGESVTVCVLTFHHSGIYLGGENGESVTVCVLTFHHSGIYVGGENGEGAARPVPSVFRLSDRRSLGGGKIVRRADHSGRRGAQPVRDDRPHTPGVSRVEEAHVLSLDEYEKQGPPTNGNMRTCYEKQYADLLRIIHRIREENTNDEVPTLPALSAEGCALHTKKGTCYQL